MKLKPVDFEEIKRAISVYEALELEHWRPVWERGDVMRGPCPVHRSHSTASRSLAITREGWYCHVCHERGDVIRLWALLLHCTMLEAALDLCRIFRIPVPRRRD